MYDREHFELMSEKQQRKHLKEFASREEPFGVFDRFKQEAGRRLKGQDSILTRIGFCAFMVGDKSIRAKRDDESGVDLPLKQCGHPVFQDIPGTGKTLAAEVAGRLLGGTYARIQGTPDLLPSHVRGSEILSRTEQGADKRRVFLGPVFNNFFLADELNRMTGATLAAFMDAMTEDHISLYTFGREVSDADLMKEILGPHSSRELSPEEVKMRITQEGMFDLPNPFMVVATQNPLDRRGTNDIPEAALDRFCMQIRMQPILPHHMDEILRADDDPSLSVIDEVCSNEAHQFYRRFIYYCVKVNPLVDRYISRIALGITPYPRLEEDHRRLEEELEEMRFHGEVVDRAFMKQWKTLYKQTIPVVNYEGEQEMVPLERIVSTGRGVRAGLAIRRLAKVRAACEGRLIVHPSDVQKVVPDVLRHRFYYMREAREYARDPARHLEMVDSIISFFLGEIKFPRYEDLYENA